MWCNSYVVVCQFIMVDENGFDDVNGKVEVEEYIMENGEIDEDEKGNQYY